jgi:hypothetical protein
MGCKHGTFLDRINKYVEDENNGFLQDVIGKELFVYLHNGVDYCDCDSDLDPSPNIQIGSIDLEKIEE